jgi:hypothetical protein
VEPPGFVENVNVQGSRRGEHLRLSAPAASDEDDIICCAEPVASGAPPFQPTALSFETENLAVLARQLIHGRGLALIHL